MEKGEENFLHVDARTTTELAQANVFDFKAHEKREGSSLHAMLQEKARAELASRYPNWQGPGAPTVELKHPDGRSVRLTALWVSRFDDVEQLEGFGDYEQYLRAGYVLPANIATVISKFRPATLQNALLDAQGVKPEPPTKPDEPTKGKGK